MLDLLYMHISNITFKLILRLLSTYITTQRIKGEVLLFSVAI